MMSKANDPAYPNSLCNACGQTTCQQFKTGMTMRQAYKMAIVADASMKAATSAHAEALSRSPVPETRIVWAEGVGNLADALLAEDVEFAARHAYVVADVMMKEREKETP